LPVDHPIFKSWNLTNSICRCQVLVGIGRDFVGQNIIDGRVDTINDCTLEENFKHTCEVGPNIAPDMNIDIIAINIDIDIY